MSQSDDDWLEFTVPPTSPPRSTGSSSFPSRRNTITDQDFDFSSRRPSLSTVIHKAVTSLATETTPSPVTKRARAVNTLEDEIHNIGDSGMIAIGSNSTRTYPHRRRDKDGARARSKSRDLDPPETPHSYSDLTADTNAITSLTSVHSPKLSVIAPEEVDLQNIQQVAQRTRGRNQKSLSTDTSRDSSRSASASRAHSNSASRNRSNSTSRAHSNSPSPHSNSRTSPHSNSRSSPHSNSRANDNNESAVGTGSRLRSATAYSKPLSRPPSVNTVPSKTSSMQSPRGKANKQDSGASQNQSPNMFSFPLSKGSTAAVVQNQGVPGWSDLAISSPNGSPRPSHPLKRRRAYTQHAPPSADLGTLQNDAAEHSRTSNPGAQTRAHVPLTSPQDGVVNTNISPLVRGTYRNVEPLESRGRQSTTSYETSRGKSPRSGTSESADKRVTRHTRVTDQSMSQGIESKTGAGSMGPLSVGKGCSEDDLTRLEIEALGDLHSSSKEGEDFDWHNTGMQDARLEIRFDREGNQLKGTHSCLWTKRDNLVMSKDVEWVTCIRVM
ncbi:hypothetical protein SARC_02610 [Sphaeroforma arctica JP610]|uniref:Uncharacterized protein n=1 Tax=Sphaeroforma arctica JP610 TaxID=667725 RepID=A0A0L0G8I9_9EUKA|nr:hypothetical protein SARC_02610 [Sphaeroforma arctica JP610]KNC85191.1 hypothetical protein SARC_02610 [Sphaeroforma arctica JP610]|eukprot:XP_014159093.1 hypothetical protein SARC_02610 [Sphaeroforma arctica JP610]